MSVSGGVPRITDVVRRLNDVKADFCSLASESTWNKVTCRGCGTGVWQNSGACDFANWNSHRNGCQKLRNEITSWKYPPGES